MPASRRRGSKAADSKTTRSKTASSSSGPSQAAASRETASRTTPPKAASDEEPASKPGGGRGNGGNGDGGGPPDLTPNPIVSELARDLARTTPPRAEAGDQSGELAPARTFAESPDLADLVSFEGYLGATVTFPADAPPTDKNEFCVLYLDWDLSGWLLIEKSGIVRRKPMNDTSTTEDPHDVLWVKVDAAVGSGRGGLSVNAQFLTGQFTRAGDFQAEMAPGGVSPATGKFCGRSPWCCGGKTVRR